MNLSKKRLTVLTVTAFFTVGMLILGISLGSVSFSLRELVYGLLTGEGTAGVIVRSLRLPRVLGALLSGAALAVSGVLLQSAVGNDLAAPNTIGINSGAGAAVMCSLCFFPGYFALENVFSFAGALLAAFVTLALAMRPRRGISRTTVVLAGVAVGAIFGAVISYLSLRYPDVLSSYAAFSVGGYSGVYMKDLPVPAAIILVALALAMLLTPRLNLLELGDELARSFGVRTGLLRTVSVALAAALASASVSFAGLVGFVGLVAPHISSRLIGRDRRFHLPMSALVGASLTTLADLIGRLAFAPTELPSGVLLNLIGAPFFLGLLLGKRKESDI